MNGTELRTARAAYCQMVRDYCESQVEVWRTIPWLALQADGRSGYNGNLARAYHWGHWALESSIGRYGGYSGFVDLANGRLIDVYPGADMDEEREARDNVVMGLTPEDIDATMIANSLRTYAQREESEFISNYTDQDRLDIAEKRGVDKLYVRKLPQETMGLGIE